MLCPAPTEAEVVGEGGGCGDPSSDCVLPLVASPRLPRLDPAGSGESADALDVLDGDLPLAADFTLRASDCSSVAVSPLSPDEEPRGLSADFPPGILVRKALLKDRMLSLVSDLLNEGYESRLGPGPVGVWEPVLLLPSLDGWLPIIVH